MRKLRKLRKLEQIGYFCVHRHDSKNYLTNLCAAVSYRKLNFRQQLEMSKREIVDQEREYKNQISALETKAHEQWVCVACMRRIRVCTLENIYVISFIL